MGKETYNFLDSLDIREFNHDTKFTPAEQAVLIARSQKQTVYEKINALYGLTENYTEEEFQKAAGQIQGPYYEQEISLRDAVLKTIRIWEETLQDRADNDGAVYTVCLCEKDYENVSEIMQHRFFSSFEKAYENLQFQKEEYLRDEYLHDVETCGIIYRFHLDSMDVSYAPYESYRYDNDLRLIEVNKTVPLDDGFDTIDTYEVFVPLPFHAGDIVKVESPFRKTYYGVWFREWKKLDNGFFDMVASIDVYDSERGKFAYTDDTDILKVSYCSEEELPEREKCLKMISKVRKGEMDFYGLLCMVQEKSDVRL